MLPLNQAPRLDEVTREIEQLVAAIAAGDASAEQVERLAQLRQLREAMSDARLDKSRVLKG